MSRLTCGCSYVILRVDDKKSHEYIGICDICIKNDGDYTKSPHWKEDESPKPKGKKK